MTIEVAPKFSEAHHQRAVLLLEKGENHKALQDLNTAIALYPNDALAIADRASVYESLGDSEAALDDLNRARQLAGDDPRAFDRKKHIGPAGAN